MTQPRLTLSDARAMITAYEAYVATFDPGFPDSVRGAAPADITALEQVLGRPLAASHRAYLERFGAEVGSLPPFAGDARLQSILGAYARRRAPQAELDAKFALVSLDDNGTDLDVHFAEGDNPALEPRLIEYAFACGPTPEFQFYLAESLATHLFSGAFHDLRILSLKARTQIAFRPADLDARALAAGFRLGPFPADSARCYDREDAAMFLFHPPPYAPMLHLAAATPAVLERLLALFQP